MGGEGKGIERGGEEWGKGGRGGRRKGEGKEEGDGGEGGKARVAPPFWNPKYATVWEKCPGEFS